MATNKQLVKEFAKLFQEFIKSRKQPKKIEDCTSKKELNSFSKQEILKFLIKKKAKALKNKRKDELINLAMKVLHEDSDSDSSDSDSDSSDSDTDTDSSDSDSSDSDSESDSDSDSD